MKLAIFCTALIAAATPLSAQTTPEPAPEAAMEDAAPAAKFSTDTPVATIMADPAGKAVMDQDLPDLQSNPSYETFKGMSLKQLQPYAPDKLPDELLAKIDADLAAVK